MFSILGTQDGAALVFLDGFASLILPMPTIPVFPTLAGLAWPVKRSPLQSTIKQEAISGKETRLQNWTYGRYRYELTFEYLLASAQSTDFQLLMSFFQLVAGAALPFHFDDVGDDQVAGQVLGTGDGTTTIFNFVRTLSLVTEPVQDVRHTTVTVRLNTSVADPSTYGFLADPNWGFKYAIQFNTAPASGVQVTADFSYYWPCRFDDDTAEFAQFMYQFWELKKLGFTTMKVV